MLPRERMQAAIGITLNLGVVLLVYPAGGCQRVAIDHVEQLVVLALAVLATRQGSPAAIRFPRIGTRRMCPATDAAIARRIVHFVNRLRPDPAGGFGGNQFVRELAMAPIAQHAGGFELPILAPVLDHDVVLAHDQDVLQ